MNRALARCGGRLGLVLVILLGSACGSALPTRYVIEHDLGRFAYRRYQKTLDIEIAIEGNAAVGHTASYVRRDADMKVAVATAFVTVYAHAASLAAEARERLAALGNYQFSVRELAGKHVWLLDGGKAERWAIWISGPYLVKIGAPATEELPEDLAHAYLSQYPSDLDEHGRARPGTGSAGPAKAATAEDRDLPLPASLREGAPR
ncbi:MAG TPA: hypothetical protein VF331_27200 [Polyangiales bacterium]